MSRGFEKIKEKDAPKETKQEIVQDYNIYTMNNKEKIIYIALAAIMIYIIAFVFYRSHIFSFLLTPAALMYPRIRVKDIVAKRKMELNIQFKDMLYSLSSSLSVGKSIELAFREVLKDLEILYPDTGTSIIKEVDNIVKKIEMNENIESVLLDFATRAKLEDIDNFVNVFYTCKRTGGNLVDVIRNTSNIINDKIEIKQEIETMLVQRRFEQKVLNILPVLMIIILSTSAEDYINPVFNTVQGRIAMSVSISLLITAYFISKKIMNIQV